MDIYDDMLRSVGFSEINESAGISKSEFRSHKFLQFSVSILDFLFLLVNNRYV